jgi:hypothetical protein
MATKDIAVYILVLQNGTMPLLTHGHRIDSCVCVLCAPLQREYFGLKKFGALSTALGNTSLGYSVNNKSQVLNSYNYFLLEKDPEYSSNLYRMPPRRKVSILAGHSICHSKQKRIYVHVSCSERFPRCSYFTVQTSNTPCPHTSYQVH